MQIELQPQPFDPLSVLAAYQNQQPQLHGRYGALASFIGSMRDYNQGDGIVAMTLEHYPGMTERELERLVTASVEQYQLLDALVVHRVGRIEPGEPIVLVAVWSAHRAEAFAACRQIMEDLKARAPFWKHERLDSGEQRWVTHNTPG